MTLTWTTLTGHDAIAYAAEHGLTLRKHADPTEGAREGLSVEEAREIAAEDPSLVWLERPAREGEGDESADLCECGCGEPATETVRLLPEQHRGTAEALGWAEMSVGPMRESVRVAAGHEEHLDGYATEPSA